MELHDPEPPASELTCARCRHPYPQHALGGGGCLHWTPPDPATRCRCPVFTYVLPDPPGRRAG